MWEQLFANACMWQSCFDFTNLKLTATTADIRNKLYTYQINKECNRNAQASWYRQLTGEFFLMLPIKIKNKFFTV